MDRNLILTTAFRVWGKDMYTKTSLSTLAKELGITKTALYRHFDNKRALLHEMLSYFIDQYELENGEMIESLGTMDFRKAVGVYVQHILKFYSRHPGYYYFYIYFLIQGLYVSQPQLNALIEREARSFADSVRREAKLDQEKMTLLLKALYTHVIFWCEFSVGNSRDEIGGSLQARGKRIVDSLFRGFFPKVSMEQFSVEKIEAILTMDSNEFIEDDPRIEAIVNVIAREGLGNTSVSKIAAELNISKSSLYSFFKNKDEMLTKVKCKHRDWLNKVAKEKLQGIEMDIEKIYGVVLLIFYGFLHNRKSAIFFNWLRHQKIDFAEGKPGFSGEAHPIFQEAYKKGTIEKYRLQPHHIEGIFSVQVVMEVMDHITEEFDVQQMHSNIRELFRILAFGMERYLC